MSTSQDHDSGPDLAGAVVPPDGVARRTILRGLAVTVAGAVAVPAIPSGAEGQHHHHSQTPAAPAAPAAAPAERPRSLDDHEVATLDAIGERLVPGSSAAGVPQMIDRLLAVDTPDTLRRFRNALGWFEREARVRHARPWLRLGEAEQAAILTAASEASRSVPEPPPWTPGIPAVTPAQPASPAPPPTGRDHFEHLRDTVARVYFGSEAGMKELGWTGNMFWEKLPECSG